MKKSFSLLFCSLMLIMAGWFTGCDPHGEYYARPEWLGPPIYQQLSDSGIFTNYLKLVDKAGYDRTLKGAGYFTVFALQMKRLSSFLTRRGFLLSMSLRMIIQKRL